MKFEVFENTDLARQLREANAPESAYLHVESLWLKNKEAEELFDMVKRSAESARDEIEHMLGAANAMGWKV